VIPPLLGIARAYRLEGLIGTDEEPSNYVDPFAVNGMGMSADHNPRGLNPDGEKALLVALQTVERIQPPEHHLRAETLTELGDWYLCADQTDRGLTRYREAWKEFQQTGSTAPLDVPRQLVYRSPSSSVTRSPLADREDADEHTIDVTFTVGRDGHTTS